MGDNCYGDGVCSWDFDAGHRAGISRRNIQVAEALNTARKNETSPAVRDALDRVARHLGLKIVTEVSYHA